MNQVKRYDEIYPYMPENCLLQAETIPNDWKDAMGMASAERWN
jgi:hypothetical protein